MFTTSWYGLDIDIFTCSPLVLTMSSQIHYVFLCEQPAPVLLTLELAFRPCCSLYLLSKLISWSLAR